jgi:hypothetical protein
MRRYAPILALGIAGLSVGFLARTVRHSPSGLAAGLLTASPYQTQLDLTPAPMVSQSATIRFDVRAAESFTQTQYFTE